MKYYQADTGEMLPHPETDAEEVYLESIWMHQQLQQWGFLGEG